MVIRHLKQIGKVKNLDKWVPHELTTNLKEVIIILKVSNKLSSPILHDDNEPFLDQIVTCNEKWILYNNLQWPAQWLDQEEAPKLFPKPNLHQRKVMVTGGLLLLWSTTVFWIPVKPWHLRSMLSRSMRCTKNFNACSHHWSTERGQFFSTTPDHTLHNQCFKSGLWSFSSPAIFTWLLTNLTLTS